MKVNGFFNTDNLSKIRIEGSACFECKLFKGCSSPKMPISGEGKKGILILGESPGEDEDRQNKQFVGETGKFLRRKLAIRGIDLDKDCWKDNAIRCRAIDKDGKNRKPSKNEITCCKEFVDESIKTLKPKYIWLLGSSAIESYFQGRFNELKITLWRGLAIPDQKHKAWVFPLFHPSFVKRKEDDRTTQNIFDRDLDQATKYLRKDHVEPYENFENFVVRCKDFNHVNRLLDAILVEKPKILTFDYETTGLKPYRKGHKIATISVCMEEGYAFSFPFQYNNHWTESQLRMIKRKWGNILKDENIGKVGHNIKFEEIWSRQILGVEPKNWVSCTMNTAHILDNRRKYTGLKFQTFINYGVEGYENTIEPFLKAKNGVFNRVMQADLDDLLFYNGLDSLFTYWLYLDQQDELKKDKKLQEAHDLFKEGLELFSEMQHNGLCVKPDYYLNQHNELENKISNLEKEIRAFPEITNFEMKKGRAINLESDFDIRELFFKQMGLKGIKQTATDLESVDFGVLSGLDTPIAKKLIRMNKLSKTKSTYIDQFVREIDDDNKIHPFCDLHTVRTYRSGSSGPNFQNIPVRDEEAKKASRSGIFPSEGNLLLDPDYGQQEVRIGACYTKDPVLIDYVNNPETDMHRDEAINIFLLKPNQVTSKLRFFAKNGFVFPQWYGSYYKSCARDLWRECQNLTTAENVPIWEHLIDKGIIKSKDLTFSSDPKSLNGFEKHIKNVEEKFWKRFKIFREWQKETMKEFEKNGYIRLLNGFKYGGGVASQNEILNAPFQGTAFHCLLWSLIELNKIIKKEKLKTKIIGQIHDSATLDTPPQEKDIIISLFEDIATKQIRERYDWLIVPLTVEWEATEVNCSWYSKKDMKNVGF